MIGRYLGPAHRVKIMPRSGQSPAPPAMPKEGWPAWPGLLG